MSSPSDDTFLLAHKILPLSYSFSPPIAPISIRDQMIRGQMFVDRAIRSNLIGKGKKLLVVGGGAAGVSLAIEAAKRKIEVVLIEKEKRAFSLQLKAPDRWIDPTQYDWPLANWTFGTYPCESLLPPAEPLPDIPLNWPAGSASILAAGWKKHLDDALANPGKFITFRPKTMLVSGFPKRVGSRLTAKFNVNGTITALEHFGCAVYAIGFGSERVPAGAYRGFKYWSGDPWDQPDLGRPDKAGKPLTIAICGVGDGALQDFLRIVTGLRSAKQLMTQLEPLLPAKLAIQLAAEEDNARRHYAWLQDSEQDHPHLKRLHTLYEAAVNQTIPLGLVQKLLDDVCGPIAKRLTINLFYSCDHFGQCFPLNHFLVLLILKWAGLRGHSVNVTDKVKLNGVTGAAPHVCKGNRSDCHKSAHRLELVPAPKCGQSGGASTFVQSDIVIVRTGNDPIVGFDLFKGRSIPRTRQLLPYTPPLT